MTAGHESTDIGDMSPTTTGAHNTNDGSSETSPRSTPSTHNRTGAHGTTGIPERRGAPVTTGTPNTTRTSNQKHPFEALDVPNRTSRG